MFYSRDGNTNFIHHGPTKNNNVVCGDIWANTYIEVYNGDSVLASTDSRCPSGGTLGSRGRTEPPPAVAC